MPNDAATLARRLAQSAEAVCGHYLSNGRRRGRYWQVGDVHNTPGQSLYVRLAGPVAGPGAAGKWTDAATGEHGDLLDLIALNLGLTELGDVLAEARRFLSLPSRESTPAVPVPRGSGEAARRLFAASRPIAGTLAAHYLRARGITCAIDFAALRFHPSCYRRDDNGALRQGPALIAAVTGLDGRITGVQRTWLAPDGLTKADVSDPRRSMGELLGHGIRIGRATQVAPHSQTASIDPNWPGRDCRNVGRYVPGPYGGRPAISSWCS
jgi:hypothetical protein